MIEANRFKLGLFVVAGVILLLVALFVLGASRLFKDTIPMYTIFHESVQGLETGASVKFKGVTIGRVKRIMIRSKDKTIRVDMETYPAALDPQPDNSAGATMGDADFFQNFFRREVQEGLRCQLVLTGITGMKYIEIDYFKDAEPVRRDGDDAGAFFLPSRPSIFAESIDNVSETIAKIAMIDFEEISEGLVSALDNINRITEDPQIGEMITRLNEMTTSLGALTKRLDSKLSDQQIGSLVSQAEDAVDSMRRLAEQTRAELESAKLAQTTESMRGTFDETRGAARSVVTFQEEASALFDQLERTLLRIEEFVRYLDEDPSSLLKGKHKERVFQGEIDE